MSDLQLLTEGRLTAVCCGVDVAYKTMITAMIRYCKILDSYDDGMAGYSWEHYPGQMANKWWNGGVTAGEAERWQRGERR